MMYSLVILCLSLALVNANECTFIAHRDYSDPGEPPFNATSPVMLHYEYPIEYKHLSSPLFFFLPFLCPQLT